jgi:hypothetical protein
MADNNSVNKIPEKLLNEIASSIHSVKGWGSVEIFIQNNVVTQITEKSIKKPKIDTVADSVTY